MKRYFIFILACLLCLGLVSCVADGTTDSTANAEDKSDRFMQVYRSYSNDTIKIWVDTETNVMYMHIKDGYGAGLTVMVDEDGKPLIWEGEE